MKCNNCQAYVRTSYEYGEYECYAGVSEEELIEDSKGNCGCKYHWKTIRKRMHEHDKCYDISLADGQRICNPDEYEKVFERANDEKYINYAKHCVGLDRHKPYKRNGKLYFKPYRNYYNTRYNDPVWSDLKWLGFAECDKTYWEVKDENQTANYWLNEDGRKWLAEKLGIFKIWEERD